MLALALATVLSAARAPIEIPSGPGDVPVQIELVVHTRAEPAAPPAPLAWSSRADGSTVGRARGAGWEARVEVAPAEAGAWALSVTLRWLAPSGLERAALHLAWPGRGRTVATDLSYEDVVRTRRVGRGTPIVAEAGGLALVGGPGFEAARYDARDGSTFEATLFLDDASDRPFATYDTCLERLPEPSGPGGHVQFAALEKRTPVLDLEREAGDVDRARATLHAVAAADSSFVPVIPERWPGGTRAAVVFTDHADRTDAPALRAILWGSTAADAACASGSGFLGRGVRITKSFFVHGPAGGLDDPEVVPLAADLVAAGSEVALHSITPGRDDRAAVAAGLGEAAPWHPVTWIDHEPYTNCEAIASSGWRTDPPFGIRDLLVRRGFRWVWSAGDLGGFGATHVPGQPPRHARIIDVFGEAEEGRPAVYPLPPDGRLWAFESTFFYAPPDDLAAALSDDELAALERRRGLFVAHTYLAAGLARTHQADHVANLAVRSLADGTLVIDPDLDAALGRIAARVLSGTLASLTWAEAGDRLLALGRLEVTYLAGGRVRISNGGGTPIQGLTLALPVEGLQVTADGVPLPHADAPGVTRVVLDLPAGASAVLAASRGVDPVPLIVPP